MSAHTHSINPFVWQMITFRFANGGTCTLRGSGTEPKLKFYVEVDSKVSEAAAQALLQDMTAHVIKEFLQPEVNGLVPRKTG
jgi:phosphoglucomutase